MFLSLDLYLELFVFNYKGIIVCLYMLIVIYDVLFFFSIFLSGATVCLSKQRSRYLSSWQTFYYGYLSTSDNKRFFFINSSLIASFSFFLFPFRFSLTSFSCCFFWGGGGACCFYFLLFHSLLSRFAFFRLCYLMNFYNCRTCLQAGEVIASLLKDAARSSLFLP